MSFFVSFIVGPTAVGKSQTALILAKELNAEIISCDSMQVYKEINIASDKPALKERQGIAHHCLDLVSVTQEFNVSRYRQAAVAAIEDIKARGKNVIFCGGSGLYMSAVLDGLAEQMSRNPVLRDQLQKRVITDGIAKLHQELAELDPLAASKIHRNDVRRIVRALEVCKTAETPMSELQTKREGIWGHMPIFIFVLNRHREELYRRVEERVDDMFKRGIVDEIKALKDLPLSTTAKVLIGIREVGGYLDGAHSQDQAKYLMKLNTRHYAKRQLTWFRKEKRAKWIEIKDETPAQIASQIKASL